MPVRRDRVPISVLVGSVIILMVGKDAVIDDVRWWNPVMAGLLVVVYLISEHQRRS